MGSLNLVTSVALKFLIHSTFLQAFNQDAWKGRAVPATGQKQNPREQFRSQLGSFPLFFISIIFCVMEVKSNPKYHTILFFLYFVRNWGTERCCDLTLIIQQIKRSIHFKISHPNAFFRNIWSAIAHSLILAPAKMNLLLFLFFSDCHVPSWVEQSAAAFSSLCKATTCFFLSFFLLSVLLSRRKTFSSSSHSFTSELETAALAALPINSMVRESSTL